jgi:hypothetical protein
MQHRIALATCCLHISAVLYLALGLLFAIGRLFLDGQCGPLITGPVGLVPVLFCLGAAFGIEKVVAGFHRRRFRAWGVALGIFALYVFSLFLPLGLLGLCGSLAAFDIQKTQSG